MKPDVAAAMRLLIGQVREAIPFDSSESQACTGICNDCSLKLLEYLDTELSDWEARLNAGERPGLGDLSRLGRTSRKVYSVVAARSSAVIGRPK
jgi:hypothetical protein